MVPADPPYPTVLWSQRDNNNYEETALLTSLSYFAHNGETFLNNFYLKSKRSIEKPTNAGPAAYVMAADERFANRQTELLRVLALQHVEIHQLKEAALKFPAGSFVIRMDQPFSRVADALLDRQFWAPDDPQKTPYDDTGWSFGDLFNAKVSRVTDKAILFRPR